jgi:XRE family aerobic/anaerobic benzoate catabolism transcriptional regulator
MHYNAPVSGARKRAPGEGPHPVLQTLAEEVRGQRFAFLWSVRELAERSGLSERFIIEVEKGTANPSVLSLVAIADALELEPFQLLISALRRQHPSGAPEPGPRVAPARFVALLGLRGAGKSTIGAAAAKVLGMRFVELDAEIEKAAGMKAAEIFELHGAEAFRRFEREALELVLADRKSAVVATSGGLVTDSAAFERVLARATTIWLKARPQDHFRRVMDQGDTRPMANRERAMDELQALLRARRALYERADEVVDTSKLGIERSVDRVVKIARSPRGD